MAADYVGIKKDHFLNLKNLYKPTVNTVPWGKAAKLLWQVGVIDPKIEYVKQLDDYF